MGMNKCGIYNYKLACGFKLDANKVLFSNKHKILLDMYSLYINLYVAIVKLFILITAQSTHH